MAEETPESKNPGMAPEDREMARRVAKAIWKAERRGKTEGSDDAKARSEEWKAQKNEKIKVAKFVVKSLKNSGITLQSSGEKPTGGDS